MAKFFDFVKGLWSKANKKLVITLASILLVVIALGIGLGIYLNTPSVVALRATSKFAKDLVARNEFQTITNTLSKGSIEASMSSVKVDDEEMLDDASVSGKIYFSESQNAVMLENFNFKVDEFKLSGNVYVSNDLIYIQEDEILNDAYGVDKKNFADDFSNSIFAYDSGSDYAIDEDLYNAIMQAYEDPQDEKMAKDSEKIVEKYTKELWKIVCKYAEFESENDKIRIDGKKKAVRVVSITIDEKAMSDITRDAIEFIVNDDSVIEFLEKYSDSLALTMYLTKMDEDTSIAELYEDMLESLEENADDICDQIEDSEFECSVEMVTPKNSAKLLMLTVKNGNEKLLTLEFGDKGVKKTDKITLSSGGSSIVYEISENNKKAYESTLKVNKEKVATIKIDYQKEKFDINLGNDDSDSIKIKGQISKKGKTTNISLDKIEYAEWEYDYWYGTQTRVTHTIETNLEITIKERDKMPKAPKDYSTIADIKEEDIESWMENLNIR